MGFTWKFLLSLLIYPVFLLPMLTDIVTTEENREHTLKNTVSFGANRSILYLSKLVSSVLLGIILMAVVLGVYCGTSVLFMPKGATFTGGFIQEFFIRVGAVCFVYIASITVAAFCSVLFRRNSLSVFLFYGMFFFTKYLFSLLHLSFLNKFLLESQISRIEKLPISQLQQPLLISLATLIIFTVLGAAYFKRRDIS